jgi:hypothetical protein
MEQNPSCEADQQIHIIFYPEGSQESTTGTYPEQDESSPHPNTLFFNIYFNVMLA